MARRLFIFSVGFIMGCVAVYLILFKDSERDFYGSWLPEGRVLKKINLGLNRSLPHYQCCLDESGIFPSELDLLLEEGDVDFSKSETKSKPRKYFTSIQLEDEREIHAVFVLKEDSAWIESLGVGALKQPNCD